MLDINLLREKPDLVKKSENKRGNDPKVVDEVLKLDTKWKKELKAMEELNHKRNVVSQEINQSKKSKDEKTAIKKIKEMRQVIDTIKDQKDKVEKIFDERQNRLRKIGNILHPTVPQGKDETNNVEIKKWGKKPTLENVKNHIELCEELDIAEFEVSAQTSGHGFYYLKGELGLLNQALISFAIDFMQGKEYTYIEPPLLLRHSFLQAAIDSEEWEKTIYTIEGEPLALIGTSEHPLLSLHANTDIAEKELPIKYFSYSMCFRKEVGAHGINEKGLWRTHQFNKVEQFIFCKPNESGKYFEELLKNSEEILQALNLPYRVIEICSGDLSLWKHRSFDLEVWRPTTKEYGEIMSLSNCTDYQTRDLGIRISNNDNKKSIVHTLNNTAMATSRIMVAILENFQTKEGSVKIPKVLHKYMNGITQIKKK